MFEKLESAVNSQRAVEIDDHSDDVWIRQVFERVMIDATLAWKGAAVAVTHLARVPA